MRTKVVLLLCIFACASPLVAADRHSQSLNGTLLKPYGDNWFTAPQAVNDRGEIAGYAVSADDEWVVFVRSTGGRYERIADRGFVHDMSDKGDVVGILFPLDDTVPPEGFIWNRRRGLQSLGSFVPFSINARGDMAGLCQSGAGDAACVLRDDIVSVIPDAIEAHSINRDRTVVGIYGDNRAFRLTKDLQFMDIGRAVAQDINERGVIAGHRFVQIPNRGERAVVTAWTKRGVRSPGDVGLGVAINDRNWLISVSFRVDAEGIEQPYAFAWNAITGARVSLESGEERFILPTAISNHGLIVGTAGEFPIVWRLKNHGSD
jgi:hypothetical protein